MTMTTLHDFTPSPQLVLGSNEHRQLTVLALAGTDHSPDAADGLLYELDRADIVPDHRLSPDIVRMGSRVRYRTSEGEVRDVTLVYPAHADITAGRISVLTPVGTALIGLRTGQSIAWRTRDNRKHVLSIIAVWQPPAEMGDDPGPDAA